MVGHGRAEFIKRCDEVFDESELRSWLAPNKWTWSQSTTFSTMLCPIQRGIMIRIRVGWALVAIASFACACSNLPSRTVQDGSLASTEAMSVLEGRWLLDTQA